MFLIYVVEDDKNIREIETYSLKNSGYEVKEFECAADFFEQMSIEKPDLILLDVMLPDDDGLSIVGKLRDDNATAQIPIILVTAKTSEIDKVKGLDIGADDYITKPFGVMELISRVKALLRRSANSRESKSIIIGDVVLDDHKHTIMVSGKVIDFTFKEYELLKLLMQNAGVVTRRETILDKVWGTDFEGESRTLDMHIKTVRQKLGESGSRIKTVRNVGYIME